MKPSIVFRLLIACVLLASAGCGASRDDSAIASREAELAGRSGINLEIEKLKDTLKSGADDRERAVASAKIAELQAVKGNMAAVFEYASQSVKYQPNLFLSRYLLGRAYLALGRYDDAETELRKSIELNKDYPPSHFELGNALYKRYDFRGAIGAYLATIRIDPGHFQARNNLAAVYSETRNLTGAEAALKELLRLKPDFAPGYKNLGVLYETRLNNRLLALEYYRKYLRIRPDSPDRDTVKAWIRALGGRS